MDAAFGGLAVLTPEFRPQLAAIAEADSVAFDFHKWLHVPYDAGCVLVRDAAAHRRAFAARPEYLAGQTQGLAAGEPWFCDFGPEMLCGFRALKIWFTLKTYGINRFAELITRNCAQAGDFALCCVACGVRAVGQGESQYRLLSIRRGWIAGGSAVDALNCRVVTEVTDAGDCRPHIHDADRGENGHSRRDHESPHHDTRSGGAGGRIAATGYDNCARNEPTVVRTCRTPALVMRRAASTSLD